MSIKKEAIIKEVQEKGIKFIRLQFADIFGIAKSISIMPNNLEKVLNNQFSFDGSSIEGFARIEESDMKLYPDLDSFKLLPASTIDGEEVLSARLICDAYTTSGEPSNSDPRIALKRVLKEAVNMGYIVNAGPECEFFLFEKDEFEGHVAFTNDKGGYFDISPVGEGGDCRRAICLALEKLGFLVEGSHHECGIGQHEIDFRYSPALEAADSIMTFKTVVKSIAKKFNLFASFMPKPIAGQAGSGMHLNLSLVDSKTGKNIFDSPSSELGLSDIAYSFIAGLLNRVAEFTAITNPLVNSYKRLNSGFEAPNFIAFSAQNRTALVRVPSARGASTRVELRSPDPSCNPYTAMAIAIAAGLEGIKLKLKAPKSVDKNIYEMSVLEKRATKIEALPTSLSEALNNLEKSQFVKSVLGSHIVKKFISAKRKEIEDYNSQITPWEIENYLGKY